MAAKGAPLSIAWWACQLGTMLLPRPSSTNSIAVSQSDRHGGLHGDVLASEWATELAARGPPVDQVDARQTLQVLQPQPGALGERVVAQGKQDIVQFEQRMLAYALDRAADCDKGELDAVRQRPSLLPRGHAIRAAVTHHRTQRPGLQRRAQLRSGRRALRRAPRQ